MNHVLSGSLGWTGVLLLSIHFNVFATDNLRLPDTRAMAAGGNGVIESSLFNPALVAFSARRSAGFHYFNKYNIKELGTLTGSFQYPNSILPAAVGIASFGYDAYRESMLHLSAAKRLNGRWVAGVAVHYTVLQTELYEESSTRLGADAGVLYAPADEWLIGLSVLNAPSVSVGDRPAYTGSMADYAVQAGIRWAIMENLLLTGSLCSGGEQPLRGGMGMEYTVFDQFRLRSGIHTSPLCPSFGAGLEAGSFGLDVAAVYHPVLGISTGVGLSFYF
ncbi:hypothetical protein Barb6_01057 [Bacteroidales bacterium Barb6]|nr:hypothetical protein Barb6_01057 [Bacteroidales bacterium Barb6]